MTGLTKIYILASIILLASCGSLKNNHKANVSGDNIVGLTISSEECVPSSASSYYPKAQSFAVHKDVELHTVEVFMNSSFNNAWSLRILSSLPDNGGQRGLIDKSALKTKTIGVSEVDSSDAGWVIFDFHDPIDLKGGQSYFIFIDSFGLGDGPDAEWCGSKAGPQPGPYLDGDGWIFVYNWSDNSNNAPSIKSYRDYSFKVNAK